MNPSTKCISLAKKFEGLRLVSYLDTAGFPTIGYGHRILEGESFPKGITIQKAEELFDKDLDNACKQVQAVVKVPLTQGQLDALTDFVFNLGIVDLMHSTLLKDLNSGMYTVACAQLILWDHVGHKEVEQLRTRRLAESMMWEDK